MQTVRVTFVQATFVLVTFVHIKNIFAVTDPMLTKLFGLNVLQGLIFLDQFFCPKLSLTKTFLDLKKNLKNNFLVVKFCRPWTLILSDLIFFWICNFFGLKILLIKKYFVLKIIIKFFCDPHLFQPKFFLDLRNF